MIILKGKDFKLVAESERLIIFISTIYNYNINKEKKIIHCREGGLGGVEWWNEEYKWEWAQIQLWGFPDYNLVVVLLLLLLFFPLIFLSLSLSLGKIVSFRRFDQTPDGLKLNTLTREWLGAVAWIGFGYQSFFLGFNPYNKGQKRFCWVSLRFFERGF